MSTGGFSEVYNKPPSSCIDVLHGLSIEMVVRSGLHTVVDTTALVENATECSGVVRFLIM
jgi:hypothetical protein